MRQWLQTLFARKSPPAHRLTRFRPGLESLEDRLTPSTAVLGRLFNAPTSPPVAGLTALGHTASPKAKAPPALVSIRSPNDTTLVLRFNRKLGRGASNPASYKIPGLVVLRAKLSKDRKSVILTTSPQQAALYSVTVTGVHTAAGALIDSAKASMTVVGTADPTAADNTPLRVTGAASTGNRTVLVSFSRAVGDSALSPSAYVLTQANVNPEAGTLRVQGVRFLGDRRAVELTTDSQNELTYTVTVVNVTDLAGNALAPPTLLPGVMINPAQANFPGTPPGGANLADSDHDGLPDNVELRGWTARYKLTDGTVLTRQVTSDPLRPDTDGDGMPDGLEAELNLDPRDPDTDRDGLTDSQEYNELFSDPGNQDSDGDGLNDGLEFNFFKTSPTQADTDGDQIPDGQEVLLADRNARVADLPTPAIEIGATSLRLDVRFVETTSSGSRTLDSRSADTTLTQTDTKSFSNSNSDTQEAMAKITSEVGGEVGGGVGESIFSAKATASVSVETGWTGTWNTTNTSESVQETQRAYEETLTTEVESTKGASVERQVVGAQMQATVFVKNASTLAYRIQNLQLTAFLQDPQDPTRLTPVATLLPDSEPAGGFTLGPLVPERGPFVFSNTTLFPNLVESLMANPRGLVYKIANFDITDELGRNFAFTSRDVIDRTGSVVIDFGGFDSNGDGEGDLTEYHRVATSAGRVVDTNGDGRINDQDHRVVFDANGKQVGITLREALAAIGLTHYDEATTPTSSLTADQVRNSYSTVTTPEGRERIFRVREVAIEEGIRKQWVMLTPTGIDPELDLDNTVVRPDSDVKLAFVQDLDRDLVPASVEALFGTSDLLKDSDKDGLDDRFETFIGWNVDLGAQGARHVFSSGTLPDSDGDGLTDRQEAPANLIDTNADGIIERAEKAGPDDYVTDPLSPDTDRDGVGDSEEINGYQPEGTTLTVKTDPTNPDTDADTASDGLEKQLGGNPTDPSDRDKFADDDRDGLANIVETDGWDITVYGVSTDALKQGPATPVHVKSDPGKADSDGDGLPDGVEYGVPDPTHAGRRIGTDPQNVDTDGDGLTDAQEVNGFQLRDKGIITLDPADADTDHDKLSDGQEAELTDVEANRWVVHVVGMDPYRTFSDPRFADADFDGLVDGDERTQGSDPNKADTDGDGRQDGTEFQQRTNLLRKDHRVTVTYVSFTPDAMLHYQFDLNVRKPDDVSPTGLAPTTQVLNDQTVEANYTMKDFQRGIFVPSDLLMFNDWVADTARSVSFAVADDERFSIEAQVRVLDQDHVNLDTTPAYQFVDLGGIEGLQGTVDGTAGRTVFEGSTLAAGIHQVTFAFQQHDLRMSANGGDDDCNGTLVAYYVVD
jgi:hypothetical protein